MMVRELLIMMGRGGIGVRVGVYYNLYSDGYRGGGDFV